MFIKLNQPLFLFVKKDFTVHRPEKLMLVY